MGSTKSLRYEVLVYQTPSSSPAFKEQQHQPSTSSLLPDDVSSSNHPGALFETKVQRFACDRENMQQYWIPEGFHPVLIPRAYLTNNSLVSTNNNNSRQPTGDVFHQLRSRINNNDNNVNDIELRRRRRINANDIFTSCNNNGGITKKKRRNNDVNRRTVLGQTSPSVNINPLIYRQKISAIRNSAVKISSNSSLKNSNSNNIIPDNNNSPSIIIGEMWKAEPDNIKKHYERLAIRKKIAKALAFEQKFSSLNSNGKFGTNNVLRSTITMNSRRHHVNPTTCPVNNNTGSSCRYTVQSNATKGMDAVDCDNAVQQSVDISSSPNNFNDSSRPIPDWTIRTNEKGDENSSDRDLGAC